MDLLDIDLYQNLVINCIRNRAAQSIIDLYPIAGETPYIHQVLKHTEICLESLVYNND